MNDPYDEPIAEPAADPQRLWPGDAGSLPESSRRALVQLLRGPYLSASRHPQLWAALLRDRDAITARLNELFLEPVVDDDGGVAYVRGVSVPEVDLPKVVRTASLTFLDTAMVLVLRQLLLAHGNDVRAIVGQDEIYEQLQVYRGRDGRDETDFGRRLNASWTNMEKHGFIARTQTAGRVEISPVLRTVFGAEEIRALREEYQRIAQEKGVGPSSDRGSDADDTDTDGEGVAEDD